MKVDVPLQRDYWLHSDALRADAGGWLVAQADAEHYPTPEEHTTDTLTDTRPPRMDAGRLTHGDSATTLPAQPATGRTGDGLQLREERLRVRTEQEQAGAARLTSRIVEYTETVAVPLREERVTIERLVGGGEVIVDGRALAEGEQVEVVVRRERVRVEKDVEELEQLAVRTEVVEHTERIHADVKREELIVEEQGDVTITSDTVARP